MRRLSIDISQEQHQQIKAIAVLQGKTIRELVLDKVFDSKDESTPWQELMSLLDKRIDEAEQQGGISTKTPDQIAAEVIQRNRTSE